MDAASAPSRPSVRVDFDPSVNALICRFEGAITVTDLHRAHDALLTAAAQGAPRGLLLDARASRSAYSLAEMTAALEAFLDDVMIERCALVAHFDEAGERARQASLIETLSVPYAVKVTAFQDCAAALDWLKSR